MKQKRKVKSLLSQKKDLNGGLMTALLLALGLALCLGSATLMTTSSVGAAGIGNPLSSFPYSGLDDKVEVLYNLQFSDPARLSGFVGEMYTDKNNDFYITSTPLVVNLEDTSTYKNEVDAGLYSNILGGSNNKVKSKNITIIGGSDNSIASPNSNAVVLGGDLDKIIGASAGSTPSVIVGGYKNEIHANHDGDVIIGGELNTILGGVSNSFILGGKNNTVSANNVIVGGSNVTGNVQNIFAFSNSSSFTPQDSNAFYLNLVGGVGINTGSAGIGVTVNGPVKFGEIDITNKTQYPCNSDNYGMIGVWTVGGTGCLVGCTASSAGDGNKWDLLDRGEACQNLCEQAAYSGSCSQIKPEIIEEPVHYNSFCTTGGTEKVDVSNASPCTPVWDKIENVVFETSLIDAKPEANCPANAANKCIYQCNSGYHLTGDTTMFAGRIGVEKCYRDCDLKIILGSGWAVTGNNGVIKHNQTVIAYNKDVVPCSYDAYSYNPITRTNGANPTGYTWGYFLDNGYGTKWDRNFTGMDTKRRYELPETCTNNAHQQRLVCVDGSMYITMSGGSVKATNILATSGGAFKDGYLGYDHNGYIYMDCQTSGYTCNLTQYNLTEAYINTGLFDEITTSPKDRNTLNGTRGTYKLCLDYIQHPSNNKECQVSVVKNAVGNHNAYDMHYEFKGCKTGSGYWPTERTGGNTRYTGTPKDDSRVCRKECRFKPIDMTSEIVKRDLYKLTLYNVSSGSCIAIDDTTNNTKHCESITVECDDGVWRDATGDIVTNDRLHLHYGYSKCKQNGNPCTGYNVSRTGYNNRVSSEPSLYGRMISTYTDHECHRMHAKNSPYPETSNGGPWNRRYRNNSGFQLNDYGNPPIQRPCEDNEYRRKLIGCDDICYHANDVINSNSPDYMQYCIKDVKDEAVCPKKGNTITAGTKYSVWEGEWNTGYYATGSCYYYCPDGKYKYSDTECRDNPVCVEPTGYDHVTLFHDTTDNVSITGGYKNYYILRNRSDGAIVRTDTVACIHCNEGIGPQYYHQEGNSCKGNQQACVGKYPEHSSHGSNYTYNGQKKAWTYTDGTLGDCLFTCNDGYEWDGYACVETACGSDYDLCTIRYYAGEGGTASPESQTVKCGTTIQLATATKKCNKLNYWYRGSQILGSGGSDFVLNTTMTVYANWSEDKSGECAPQCNGGERPSGGHIIINDDPGDDPDRPWQFVSGYSGYDFTSLGTCQWACERGYMRGTGSNSGTCVEKPCGTDNTHNKPTGTTVRYLKTTYVGWDGVKWTYTGTTVGNATQPDNNTPNFDTTQNREKCLWTCKAGYTRQGSTCVKRTCYKNSTINPTNISTSPVPPIANSITGTGLFASINNLYWTGVKSNPGPCEWACTGGYTRLKLNGNCTNTCVPIHDGKCTRTNSKRVGNNYTSGQCYTGTHGQITTSGNKYIWDCITNNSGSVCYTDVVGTTDTNCYGCKPGYTGSACKEILNASCDNSKYLGCKYTGVSTTSYNTDGYPDEDTTTIMKWHCNGKNNGTSTSTYSCFKCKYGYRWNGSYCQEISNACGPNKDNPCEDEHAEVDGPYYDSTNHLYTWECQGNPCEACESGYNEKNGSDSKCLPCNNCAKNGWPYCFPIDFSSSCDESRYNDLTDYRYS